MTDKPIKNYSASVQVRLLNLAKHNGDDYQLMLRRYAIERLLYRLSRTSARNTYTLKGAMLFATWPKHVFRPTGDLDLLGTGDPTPATIVEGFEPICQVDFAEDGIKFDADTLSAEAMREAEHYPGVRLTVVARLGKIPIKVQIDIGFGDHVHPEAQFRKFPGLLDELPQAEVRMYPHQTVVAEKFEAMVRFGETNGRIKDFYDIWVTTQEFQFENDDLILAIAGTFDRRGTPIPGEMPVALLPAFAERKDKQDLWSGFLKRTPPTLVPPPLAEVLTHLRAFFGPLFPPLNGQAIPFATWDRSLGEWR